MARILGLGALALAGHALAQGNGAPSAITTTDTATSVTSAGASQMTASSALKLAKRYTADEFYSEWGKSSDSQAGTTHAQTGSRTTTRQGAMSSEPASHRATLADRSYVSQGDAQNLGLAAKQADGSFIMRADAENTASGRGRNSVRISSKAKFADVSSRHTSDHC